MILYEDRISSAAARVRIACSLKGVNVERKQIPILGNEAQNRLPEYLKLNPQGLVPALLSDEGDLVTQSLAIVEYLEDRFPQPTLLPKTAEERAFARSVALTVAAEIHALLPPRVATYLRESAGVDATALKQWNHHWIKEGLDAVEARIARRGKTPFVLGEHPTIADIFIFPQAVNVERAGLGLEQWPRIASLMTHLRTIPAFAENAPTPRT